jgi:hypothetical protein
MEKIVDIVGLYHNRPEKAVVLCTDERSQVQALDRSQPGRPTPMRRMRFSLPVHDGKLGSAFQAPFGGLYLLKGVPVTVCVVATVAWEGSSGVSVFG